ncbi:MAG: hypothetical protein AAF639_34965 [Chloroflexota bacterium]
MDYLSSGIQLADENLNHRTAKFMADDTLVKVDKIRAKWGAVLMFNEWHSKPMQTPISVHRKQFGNALETSQRPT